MTTTMMESFGQTFIVASSVVKDDEYAQQETDEDSGSFYDEDDDSQDGDEDDEDESDGSLGGGACYLGTAKYFAGSGRNFEPEMMGFSDSFVTDQDCSERIDDLGDEEDYGSPNSSPDSSNRENNGGMDISKNSMETSVHEDVLSFDKMLGKRQASSASLGGNSTASADLSQYTVSGHGAPLNSSNRGASSRGMNNSSKSIRDRSRSRSNSQQRSRRRSTSRSSQDGPPLEKTRSLMPPDSDEDDHDHDLLSMIPVAPNNQPQSARTRPVRNKSLGHEDRIPPSSASSRGKGGSRTPTNRTPDTNKPVRSFQGPRRDSEMVYREPTSTTPVPKEETPRTRRAVGRRGSIETRRQQRRGTGTYMDSSSKRSSGGESLDSSNDVSLRHSSRQGSIRRLGSREQIPPRTRSLSNSQGGAAERRRSKTGSNLLSPDLIAEKLLTADNDDEDEPNHVFDELRRSQIRSTARRRSTAGYETTRRRSIGMGTTGMETARMSAQKQLSQRELETHRATQSSEDLPEAGTASKGMRRTTRSADNSNAMTSNSMSGSSRAMREKRVGMAASANRARVRRHRSSEMLEASGGSIEDDSEGRHGARRDSSVHRQGSIGRRKMGMKPASHKQQRNMARSKSEPTEVLHHLMYDDIDDDTVAAMGTSDTKTKALQRKEAALAASKAMSENKAGSAKKILQIQ